MSSCFLSLCSRILSQHHFFFGEGVNFSAKRPMSQKFFVFIKLVVLFLPTNKQTTKKSFEEEEDESGEGSSFDGDHGGREEEILRGVTVARVEDAHEHAERV